MSCGLLNLRDFTSSPRSQQFTLFPGWNSLRDASSIILIIKPSSLPLPSSSHNHRQPSLPLLHTYTYKTLEESAGQSIDWAGPLEALISFKVAQLVQVLQSRSNEEKERGGNSLAFPPSFNPQ